MTRFLMPTRECRGLELPNIAGNPSGVKFPARDGIVTIHGPAADYFRGAGMEAIPEANFAGSAGAERVCPECSMRNWPWVMVCGRCRADLSKENVHAA